MIAFLDISHRGKDYISGSTTMPPIEWCAVGATSIGSREMIEATATCSSRGLRA
jgi:hypothetical protein